MKLKFNKNTSPRKIARLTKKIRIRKTVKGTTDRPRLCVYRSAKHMYAQVIDDTKGVTIISTASMKLSESASGKEQAKLVGMEIAKIALKNNIKNVVFDRNGYLFHGRVKSLADGAREGGLNF